MVGRGGGKNVVNRSIPPRRLQSMNQSARNNPTNIENGYKRKSNVVGDENGRHLFSEDDVNSTVRNLSRQRTSFNLDKEHEALILNDHNNVEHVINASHQVEENVLDDGESGGLVTARNEEGTLGKRKRMSKLTERITQAIDVNEAANPIPRAVQNNDHVDECDQGDIQGLNEATSKTVGKGNRGKYKSIVVDMKIKGKGSKLKIEIPDEIDRAIGENARHLVNECGRVVRTRAPLNVKHWEEAFSMVGDCMWKEIEDKFQIAESSHYLKMYAFVVETMQRLYRLWKCRLHYYYKNPKCGKTDQEREKNPPPDLPIEQWKYCVKHFGSEEFKIVSKRNSKNRLSDKRATHTTGNLAFVEVEDILTKKNNNVKPSADVVWLIEHTRKNEKGDLEWADTTRSKTIHDQLKHVVAEVGDTMSEEEILLQVLQPRSGYIRGKGTAVRGYVKGKQQVVQRKLVEEQQGKIQEQEQRIKELEESQHKQKQEFEEIQKIQKQELEEYKAQQASELEAFKQDLLRQLANTGVQ